MNGLLHLNTAFAVWLTTYNLETSISILTLGHQGFSGRKGSLQSQTHTLSHHNPRAIITDAKTGDSLETGKCFHKYLPIIWRVTNNTSLWTIANHAAIFYAKQLWVLSSILTAWPASPSTHGLGNWEGKTDIFIYNCWLKFKVQLKSIHTYILFNSFYGKDFDITTIVAMNMISAVTWARKNTPREGNAFLSARSYGGSSLGSLRLHMNLMQEHARACKERLRTVGAVHVNSKMTQVVNKEAEVSKRSTKMPESPTFWGRDLCRLWLLWGKQNSSQGSLCWDIPGSTSLSSLPWVYPGKPFIPQDPR